MAKQTNKQTNKQVAFLIGVFLGAIIGCEYQTSVSLLDEDQEVVEFQLNEERGNLIHKRSYYEAGVITSGEDLTDGNKEFIESQGLGLHQYSKSESLMWKTGESSFNITLNETEVGPLYIIDPCTDEGYDGDIDCGGFPPPPPVSPEPIPPLIIYAAYDSFVSPSVHTGYVQMGSWSATSQGIDFMGIAGTSYRDYMFLGGYTDGGANRAFAGVAHVASKPGFPFSDAVRWEQIGEHYFEHNGGYAIVYSFDNTNF